MQRPGVGAKGEEVAFVEMKNLVIGGRVIEMPPQFTPHGKWKITLDDGAMDHEAVHENRVAAVLMRLCLKLGYRAELTPARIELTAVPPIRNST